MPINNVMRAALRAISRARPDIRENYERTRRLFDAAHPPIADAFYIWDHNVTSGDHSIPVRIFLPEVHTPEHVLVFFHGGGWVTGNIDSYTTVCSRTAKLTHCGVVLVDYSLAPEHPFPAGLEDCYAVTKEVFQSLDGFGIDADNVFLMGDSAGGNLAAAVSLLASERGEFMPRKQILIYPCTYNDHSPSSPYPSVVENGTDYILTSKNVCEYLELYLGENHDAWNSPYFAPLLAQDLRGQPETLILTAEFCPLRDEGEDYGRRLLEAGNKVEIHRIESAIHGYFSLPPNFAPVRRSYELINEFLKL
ncbi:MAG: alpha/beta hydrolase [Angelakisella sp.]